MSSIASDDMSLRLAVHSHNTWPSISRDGVAAFDDKVLWAWRDAAHRSAAVPWKDGTPLATSPGHGTWPWGDGHQEEGAMPRLSQLYRRWGEGQIALEELRFGVACEFICAGTAHCPRGGNEVVWSVTQSLPHPTNREPGGSPGGGMEIDQDIWVHSTK